MNKSFKPMQAASVEDLSKLQYPLIVSPKLDGIRCIIRDDGIPLTRSLKPIPNRWIKKVLSAPSAQRLLAGLDGEIIVGPPTSDTVFNTTTSAVMSQDGEPSFYFYAFDDFSQPDFHFPARRLRIRHVANHLGFVKEVEQYQVHDEQSLLSFEHRCLAEGYEGIMLRKVESIYKFGRSTFKEGYLMKLKRFKDSEAIVIGMTELMHNGNKAETNALGQKERSSKKANMKGRGTMGSLLVRAMFNGKVIEFEIGTGFTAEQRDWWWKLGSCLASPIYEGKMIIKYKYQLVGVKDKPRFPVYLGIRDRRDM